ncbi:hypothetical protein B0I35DRAFT_507291 [Stachybotrys elegans]|uniref:Zn(2)-C6 fungal-type domain-containing protein n=1 Tax=Stachybotrys elegans TaxID=80388 RepID=A0A8K0T1S0_9HYPO|nr:hypothetical protein B0I35DRAFT_507291 [Stachybotrys elegans]
MDLKIDSALQQRTAVQASVEAQHPLGVDSAPSPTSTNAIQRRERGAIAAQVSVMATCFFNDSQGRAPPHVWATRQDEFIRGHLLRLACETCRFRKTRCNEGRPTCNTCRKFGIPCNYREAQPTKKDRTLTEILERLKNLEAKIDDMNTRDVLIPPVCTVADPSVSSPPSPPTTTGPQLPSVPISPSYAVKSPESLVLPRLKMLHWPAVQTLLNFVDAKLRPVASDLKTVADSGMSENGGSPGALSLDSSQPTRNDSVASLNQALEYHSPLPVVGLRDFEIDWDTIQRLAKSYFDLYNFLHPILDRHWFNSTIFSSVLGAGFGDNSASILVLLILALGEVAETVTSGVPVSLHKGRPSGIKGGTINNPPGSVFFNEARKRMGFVLNDVTLDNVQMFALTALYHEACGQTQECQRTVLSASLACKLLITSKPNELQGPNADLIRRVFWHCYMMEASSSSSEYQVNLAALERLSDVVGLPTFPEPLTPEDYVGNQSSHFQDHFTSRVVLHQLSRSIETFRFESSTLESSPTSQALPLSIKQLAEGLGHWRAMLPAHLRWSDEHALSFSGPGFFNDVYPGHAINSSFMFTSDPDLQAGGGLYAVDIQVALLRTSYYSAKYQLYQPFVFKALHQPQSLTQEDAEGAAICLRSCLKWPIAMSPPCSNKRIIPTSSYWSQQFFYILILLHLSEQHPMLMSIRASLCGQNFAQEASETVNMYMEWLRDVRSMDATADWFWNVARVLYGAGG